MRFVEDREDFIRPASEDLMLVRSVDGIEVKLLLLSVGEEGGTRILISSEGSAMSYGAVNFSAAFSAWRLR